MLNINHYTRMCAAALIAFSNSESIAQAADGKIRNWLMERVLVTAQKRMIAYAPGIQPVSALGPIKPMLGSGA
ncbi:MAG: hypothetical protein ACPHN3_09405, partial [Spongiibacter sp.]